MLQKTLCFLKKPSLSQAKKPPKPTQSSIFLWGGVLVIVMLQFSSTSFTVLAWDRVAVNQGEYWRIVTAVIVHYDWQHVLLNLLSAVPPAFWLVRYFPHTLWQLYFLSTVSVTTYLLLYRVDVGVFAGMSGYVTALWCYFLLLLCKQQRYRYFMSIIMLLLLLKIIAEAAGIQALWHGNNTYQVLWEAHAMGMAAALLLFIIKRMSGDSQAWA